MLIVLALDKEAEYLVKEVAGAFWSIIDQENFLKIMDKKALLAHINSNPPSPTKPLMVLVVSVYSNSAFNVQETLKQLRSVVRPYEALTVNIWCRVSDDNIEKIVTALGETAIGAVPHANRTWLITDRDSDDVKRTRRDDFSSLWHLIVILNGVSENRFLNYEDKLFFSLPGTNPSTSLGTFYFISAGFPYGEIWEEVCRKRYKWLRGKWKPENVNEAKITGSRSPLIEPIELGLPPLEELSGWEKINIPKFEAYVSGAPPSGRMELLHENVWETLRDDKALKEAIKSGKSDYRKRFDEYFGIKEAGCRKSSSTIRSRIKSSLAGAREGNNLEDIGSLLTVSEKIKAGLDAYENKMKNMCKRFNISDMSDSEKSFKLGKEAEEKLLEQALLKWWKWRGITAGVRGILWMVLCLIALFYIKDVKIKISLGFFSLLGPIFAYIFIRNLKKNHLKKLNALYEQLTYQLSKWKSIIENARQERFYSGAAGVAIRLIYRVIADLKVWRTNISNITKIFEKNLDKLYICSCKPLKKKLLTSQQIEELVDNGTLSLPNGCPISGFKCVTTERLKNEFTIFISALLEKSASIKAAIDVLGNMACEDVKELSLSPLINLNESSAYPIWRQCLKDLKNEGASSNARLQLPAINGLKIDRSTFDVEKKVKDITAKPQNYMTPVEKDIAAGITMIEKSPVSNEVAIVGWVQLPKGL